MCIIRIIEILTKGIINNEGITKQKFSTETGVLQEKVSDKICHIGRKCQGYLQGFRYVLYWKSL